MKNPHLIGQPYAHWIADILTRFENGAPLNSEQLNFLIQHEKILSTHDLDLVFKYYLGSHDADKKPEPVLALNLPAQRLDETTIHQVRDTVQNLLKTELKHVDLQMSMDQFLRFKAVGLHELIYWHGPQFLSRTSAFTLAVPQVIYIQWGKLFGVVKLNTLNNSNILDGNVLIYFEDLSNRTLNRCVMDYAKDHKIELNQTHDLTEAPAQEVPRTLPRPGHSFVIIHPDDPKD